MASPGQHLKQFFSQKQQICGLVAFPPSGGGLTNTITVLNQKGRITFHSFPCLQLSEAKRLHRQNYAVVCLRRKKKDCTRTIYLCACAYLFVYTWMPDDKSVLPKVMKSVLPKVSVQSVRSVWFLDIVWSDAFGVALSDAGTLETCRVIFTSCALTSASQGPLKSGKIQRHVDELPWA